MLESKLWRSDLSDKGGENAMAPWTSKDTAKATGASGRDTSRATHDARDSAFGSRESGSRDYNSTGDRFSVDRSIMSGIESDRGLTRGGDSRSGSGTSSSGGSGGSGSSGK